MTEAAPLRSMPSHYQSWRRLLFLHWACDPRLLGDRIPNALAVDTFEGHAYLGLVLFAIPSLRPPRGPAGVKLAFMETNVRTYVRGPDGRTGVYFFSLDAGSRLAVLGARVFTGLPYYFAKGAESVDAGHVTYSLVRQTPPGPRVHARYRIGPPCGPAAPGSLAHFVVERYTLFVQRGPTTWSIDVRHQPYPLHDVSLEALDDALVRASGIGIPQYSRGPDHIAYASGVDVAVGFPRLAGLS